MSLKFLYRIFTVLALCIIGLLPTKSFASHIVGADMYYTHISGFSYRVTVVLYGDCGPSSAGAFGSLPTSAPQVCVYNGATLFSTLALNIVPPSAGVEITPVCAADLALTQCTNPSFSIPGIKKFVYSADVVLSGASSVWRFVYDGANGSTAGSAGRALAITNLTSAGITNIQLIDTLNNLSFPANSNPILTTIPTPFFCLNEANNYNPGAVDVDGDNLAFSLVSAVSGSTNCGTPGSAVTYTGAAWPGQPIGPTTPLQCLAASYFFNTSTGQLSFNPNFPQRSVVVYNIREYRGGILVGTSQREMTFYVRPCTNLPPSGIFDSSSAGLITDTTTLQICSGSGLVNAYINPTDPDGDTIAVTYSGLPPGATFTTIDNNTTHPHSTFSWNTTGVTPGTYTFFVTFTDYNCPDAGTLTRAFTIIVTPPVLLSGTASICVGTTTTLTATPVGGTWSSSTPPVATISSTGVVTGASVGTSTISYVTATGCSSTMVVTVSALPTVNVITGPTVVCEGSAITLSNTTPGGNWTVSGPATIGSSSGILTGTGGGTATVFYAIPSSCGPVFSSYIVTVDPLPPIVTIAGTDTICLGSSSAFTASVPGGTWSGGGAFFSVSSTGVVTGLSAGTALLTYTLTNSCGIRTATFPVSILYPAPPVVSLSGPSSVCVSSAIILVPSPAGGVFVSGNPSIATVSAGGIVGGVSAGTVTISYTASNICASATAIKIVTVTPLATVGIVTGPDTVCEGSSITLSNPTPGGTWSATGAATVNATTGEVTGIAGGTAIVTYAVSNMCNTAIATKMVTVSPLPIPATISGPSIVCIGTSITLTASISDGVWSGGAPAVTVSSSGVVTGLTTGTAAITYTLTNSCGSSYSTHVVTVNNVPSPGGVITGPGNVCVGATITLSATTPGGTWTSSSPATGTVSATGVVGGVSGGPTTISYAVTTAACGASAAVHVVTVNTAPVLDTIAGPDRVCVGGAVPYTHSTASGTWVASGSATITTAGLLTGTAGGTAIVTYTVANSCGTTSVYKTVTVDIAPDAGLISGPDTVCGGWSISMTATVAGGTWAVSGSGTTVSSGGVVSGGAPGTAVVTYTVINGCGTASVLDTITVRPGTSAPGSIAGPSVLCVGASGTMTFTLSGGTWTSADPSIVTITTGGVVSGITTGSTTISYAYTDTCGTYYATRPISVDSLPSAGPISGVLSFCAGSSTVLSAPGSGAWSSGAGISVSSSGVVSSTTAGTGTITYSVTNLCGTSSVSAVVTVNPLPSHGVITGPDTICIGSSTSLLPSVSGGSWTGGAPFASVSAAGTVTGFSPGVAVISYGVTNSCGTLYATKSVTVSAPPSAPAITGPVTFCIGTTVTLSASVAGGTWSTLGTGIVTISPTGVVSGVGAGSAVISYTISSACGSASGIYNVTVDPIPTPGTVSGATSVCVGSSIALSATPSGGTWSGSGAATVSASGVVTGITGGLVLISYTISNTCGSSVATHLVTVNAAPSAGVISGPSTVCTWGAITLSSTVAGGTWSSGSSAATVSAGGVVTGVSTGTVVISYTVVNGCGPAVATYIVTVTPGGPAPGPITGTGVLCVGATTSLVGATGGGVWLSGMPTIATVTSGGVVTGVSPGTAVISYSVSTGSCGLLTSVRIVTINPLPAVPVLSGASSVCLGGSVLVSGTPAGGTWSGSGSISVTSGGVVTGTSAGTGTVTYTVSNICGTSVATHNLTVVSPPVAAVISGPSSTCTGWSVPLSASIAGGVWSGGSPTATVSAGGIVTGAALGTAVITYTISNACGSVFSTYTVTISAAPVPSGAVTGPLTLCVGATGSYSHPLAGIWSSSNPLVASISASGLVTALGAGTAIISHSIGGPCGSAISTTVLIVTAPPMPAVISGPSSLCIGATAVFTASTAGGVWTISGAGSVSAGGVVTGTGAGTAIVTYTITNSCGSAIATHALTINPLPAPATITGPVSVCLGATTIPLTASVPGGAWLGGAPNASVSASGVVSGLTTGTTIITYLVTNGCGSTISLHNMSVDVPPVPATITGTTTICVGTTGTLSASIGGGTWMSGSPATASVSAGGVVTGLATGTAVITYTITNGCGSAVATTVVTVLPGTPVAPITGPSAVCLTGTITLSCATPGGVWSISGSATISSSGVVSGLSGGTATVTYTVSGGLCGPVYVTRVIAIDVTPVAGTITGPTVVCQGQTIALSASVSGGIWSAVGSVATVSSSGVVSGVIAGTAVISYQVSNACGAVWATHVVTVIPAPSAGALSGPSTLCAGSTGVITPTVPGGTWQGGSVGVATISATGIVTGIGAGTALFTYTVTDGTCFSTVIHTISVNPLPVAGAIAGGPIVCVGNTISMTATVSGGTWSCTATPAGAATISSSGVVSGIAAGTAIVTYAVTNSCGTATVTASINIAPIPDAGTINGPAVTCEGQSATFTATASISGVWSVSPASVATISGTGVLSAVAAGSATVTYTVASAAGCTATVVKNIVVSPLPFVGIVSGPSQLCTSGSVTLTATAAGGTWSVFNSTVATIGATSGIITPVAAGTTVVTYTVGPDAAGCSNTATHTITVLANAPFMVTANVQDTRCYDTQDGSIDITISGSVGAVQYLWTHGAVTQDVSGLPPGPYGVTVTDNSNGCMVIRTFGIARPDSLFIDVTVTDERCNMANGNASANVSGGTSPYNYTWSNGANSASISGVSKGNYVVTVNDKNLCKKDFPVAVGEGNCNDIGVNTGVSPNGDGVNDYWVVTGLENYPNNLVQLFDKWGDLVFEKHAYDNKWDGRGRTGVPLPDGTYFYVIKLNAANGAGGKDVMTGAILIKR